MTEFLKCYSECPFRAPLIRPCSGEVYKNNKICIENITTDPAIQKLGAVAIDVSMDNLMNKEVEIKAGKRLVAIIDRGAVNFKSVRSQS